MFQRPLLIAQHIIMAAPFSFPQEGSGADRVLRLSKSIYWKRNPGYPDSSFRTFHLEMTEVFSHLIKIITGAPIRGSGKIGPAGPIQFLLLFREGPGIRGRP